MRIRAAGAKGIHARPRWMCVSGRPWQELLGNLKTQFVKGNSRIWGVEMQTCGYLAML